MLIATTLRFWIGFDLFFSIVLLLKLYFLIALLTLLLVSHFPLLQRLCDNDPGVMGATLCPLFDLITVDVSSYKDLVVSFVSILKQVAERRLPKSYDYHQMAAPFIQVCDKLVGSFTCKFRLKFYK